MRHGKMIEIENRRVPEHRPRDFQGILVLGIPHVVLEELMFKIVRWKLRDMLSLSCISENSQVQMTFSVGESTSRPKCA